MTAQAARPADVREIDPSALTPFQRALLVLDGTVTKFIEAYALEPVDIVRLAQQWQRAPANQQWLEVPDGTPVARRQVLIQGRHSGTFYAYATSVLVLERLPPPIREGIERQGEGIGRLLNDTAVETRREVLWCGLEQVQHLPDAVARVCDGDFISRAYRIHANGLPVALINERFPLAPAAAGKQSALPSDTMASLKIRD